MGAPCCSSKQWAARVRAWLPAVHEGAALVQQPALCAVRGPPHGQRCAAAAAPPAAGSRTLLEHCLMVFVQPSFTHKRALAAGHSYGCHALALTPAPHTLPAPQCALAPGSSARSASSRRWSASASGAVISAHQTWPHSRLSACGSAPRCCRAAGMAAAWGAGWPRGRWLAGSMSALWPQERRLAAWQLAQPSGRPAAGTTGAC